MITIFIMLIVWNYKDKIKYLIIKIFYKCIIVYYLKNSINNIQNIN